jgi:hypothetical protein
MSMKQTSGLRTSQMKRSVRPLILLPLIPRAYLFSQRTCYERNPKIGSLLRILPQTIILRERPTTREQHPGFSKVAFTNSGRSLLLSCGSMANVTPFLSTSSYSTDSHFCSRLRQKRSVVCYLPLLMPASTYNTAQLWHNRRHHGRTRSRIVNSDLFLL